MLIRQIKEKDNLEVEKLIRDCLIEFGGNRPGCAWEDKDLGRFYQVYQPDNRQYLVVIKDGHVVGGCGIRPVISVCEKALSKMLFRNFLTDGCSESFLS